MQRLVEEIASSPAVRSALVRQTASLGDEWLPAFAARRRASTTVRSARRTDGSVGRRGRSP